MYTLPHRCVCSLMCICLYVTFHCWFKIKRLLSARPSQHSCQDLMAGSPLGLKCPFIIHYQQQRQGGRGRLLRTKPFLSAKTPASDSGTLTMQGLSVGSFYLLQCGGGGGARRSGYTVGDETPGQSIHLILRHVASFQSCQG